MYGDITKTTNSFWQSTVCHTNYISNTATKRTKYLSGQGLDRKRPIDDVDNTPASQQPPPKTTIKNYIVVGATARTVAHHSTNPEPPESRHKSRARTYTNK